MAAVYDYNISMRMRVYILLPFSCRVFADTLLPCRSCHAATAAAAAITLIF